MRLMLAPMEGVIDHTMRELLTSLGGVDRCVTEFVRVSGQLLPARVFKRYCPELQRGGTTLGGVPVYVLPSTSGLNAGTSLDDLVAHLRAAAAGPT